MIDIDLNKRILKLTEELKTQLEVPEAKIIAHVLLLASERIKEGEGLK